MSNSELYFVMSTMKSVLRSPDKDFVLREINTLVDNVIQQTQKPISKKSEESEED